MCFNKYKDKQGIHFDCAVLNMRHDFTTMQQKLWHYMLYFALSYAQNTDIYKISLARLVGYLNLKNSIEIKAKLLGMGRCETSSEFTYYFEQIQISGDTVFYSYPEHLQILFSHACIQDIIQKFLNIPFTSKYNLFLYEFVLFSYFFDAYHFIPLSGFRNFLGLSSTQYGSTRALQNIIIQSLYEINTLTPFNVVIKYKKEGNVIIGLMISITKKKMIEDKFDEIHKNIRPRYELFLLNLAYTRYYQLPKIAREKIEELFISSLATEPTTSNQKITEKKTQFLIKHFLAPYELFVDQP